jgi:tRNA threonylcarbamoyl adenosine modification protein YeaZ
VLVLAVDTSTPAVTAGVVRVDTGAQNPAAHELLASRVVVDARLHAEILTPNIVECLAEAGLTSSDLEAVVVGVGPGPFTGLRVGMATAAAFGDALGIAVHGVCSLDAIAMQLQIDDEVLVVTDARRREVYSARYLRGKRIAGPDVCAPHQVDIGGATAAAGSLPHTALFDLPVLGVQTPSPVGLVAAAIDSLRSGATPEPLVPLYLRRPDAKTIEERAAAKASAS